MKTITVGMMFDTPWPDEWDLVGVELFWVPEEGHARALEWVGETMDTGEVEVHDCPPHTVYVGHNRTMLVAPAVVPE